MKVIKGLLAVILSLIIMLCLLIGLSAANPELFKNFGKKDAPDTEETAGVSDDAAESDTEEEPEGSLSDNDSLSADEAENKLIADSYFAEEKGDIPQAGLRGGITPLYTEPETKADSVPDALKALTGLELPEGELVILDDAEADRIESELSTGPTGDDLDFDKEFYPYYHMLDTRGQHLYRQLYANATEFNPVFRSVETDMPWSSFSNTFEALFNDHPELYWLNTGYSARYRNSGECLEIRLSFNRTANDPEASSEHFNDGANAIGGQASGDEYEQEKRVHDAIREAFRYSLSAEMNQSAYSGLVNHSTVCAGYARAFQYIMQNLGIPCYYCRGTAGEPHAWNIIKLYDGYYNVDVTWDDGDAGGQYAYFNLSDAEIGKDHRRKGLSVYLPACEGGNYSHLEDEEADDGQEGSGEEGEAPAELPEGVYCRSLEEYYDLCKKEINDTGKGIYSFDIYTTDRSVYDKCVDAYTNRKVETAYMKECLNETEDAKGLLVELDAKEIDGVYKLTQNVQFW